MKKQVALLALAICLCVAAQVPTAPPTTPPEVPDTDFTAFSLSPSGGVTRIEYRYIERVVYKEPSFTNVSITVSNRVTGQVKNAFTARVPGDYRFWTVVNTNGMFVLRERYALDKPWHDVFVTDQWGEDWAIFSFEAYAFLPEGP